MITGYTKTTETRTRVVNQAGTMVTFHQVRTVTLATDVTVGHATAAPSADGVIASPTENPQANTGSSYLYSSTVDYDPVTGKWTKTNTYPSSYSDWTNESREES